MSVAIHLYFLALSHHWVLQDWDAHLVSLCLTWLICPLHKSKCTAGLGLLSLTVQVVSFPFSLLSPLARGLQLSPPSSGALWYCPAHSSSITSPNFTKFQLFSYFLLSFSGHSHSPCKPRAISLLSALSHMLYDSWGFSHLAGLTLPTVSICDSGSGARHKWVCT